MVLSYTSASSYPTTGNVLVSEKFSSFFQQNTLWFFYFCNYICTEKVTNVCGLFQFKPSILLICWLCNSIFFHFAGNLITFTIRENCAFKNFGIDNLFFYASKPLIVLLELVSKNKNWERYILLIFWNIVNCSGR